MSRSHGDAVRPLTRIVALAMGVTVPGLLPSRAGAQEAERSRRWTVELFGGASPATPAGGGTAAPFPSGAPFALISGPSSRAVSSWYFGDGAALLNQVLSQFAAGSTAAFPRISPLESAFQDGGARRSGGGVFGARLGRALTRSVGLELSLERSAAGLRLSDAARDGLKTSSDSFETAFRSLLGSAPVGGLTVGSNLVIPDVSNAQTRITASLTWRLFGKGGLEGRLVGGGGWVMNSGRSPEATLTGRYTFRFFGVFPMDETDKVTVRIAQPKSGVMAVAGGGLSYNWSKRSGLRAEFRLAMTSNRETTMLVATPVVASLAPTSTLATAAEISPGLQFSTQAGARSSLGGPSASHTLVAGSGWNRQAAFTLGIVRRF